MAKPLRGEVDAVLDGTSYVLRLSAGDIEELEASTDLGCLALLRSFETNAQWRRSKMVLKLAMTEDGKKMSANRVERIAEKAGFVESAAAAAKVLTSVFVDLNSGNADAAAPGDGNGRIDFRQIFKVACGMMRFTPDQVRAMSLAEVFLAIDGFSEMQSAQAGVRPDAFPTQEEHEEIMRLCG